MLVRLSFAEIFLYAEIMRRASSNRAGFIFQLPTRSLFDFDGMGIV